MSATSALQTSKADPALRLDLVPLRQDADLSVWRYRGASSRLVLVFSGVGDSIDAPVRPEMMRTATANGRDSALFIADPRRSWLNQPGLIDTIAALAKAEASALGATEICTIGHSMGGFMALVMPAFVPVKTSLAMSPQFSVHPDLAAADDRWMDYRNRIPHHSIRNALDHVVPQTRYTVIFGHDRREAVQRNLSRPFANVTQFVLRGVAHRTSLQMKRAGILESAIAAAFAQQSQRLLQILQTAFTVIHVQPVGETE